MAEQRMTLAEAERLLGKARERARRSREARRAKLQEAKRLVAEAQAKSKK